MISLILNRINADKTKRLFDNYLSLSNQGMSVDKEIHEMKRLSRMQPKNYICNYYLANYYFSNYHPVFKKECLDYGYRYYERFKKYCTESEYICVLEGRIQIYLKGRTSINEDEIIKINKSAGMDCCNFFAHDCVKIGNYKDSEEYFKKYLQLSNLHPGKTKHDLATVLFKENKFEEALDLFNSPEIPLEWKRLLNIALTYKELKQTDMAFDFFEQALELSKSDECIEFVYANRWKLFEIAKDYDSAINELKKCASFIVGKKSYSNINPDFHFIRLYTCRNNNLDLNEYLKCASRLIEKNKVNYFVLGLDAVILYNERGSEILDIMREIWLLFQELKIPKNDKLNIYREKNVMIDEYKNGKMRVNNVSHFYNKGAEGKIISKLLNVNAEGNDIPIFIKCASRFNHNENKMYRNFSIRGKGCMGYRWCLDAWQFRNDAYFVYSNEIVNLNFEYPVRVIYAEENGKYFCYYDDNDNVVNITNKIINILSKIKKLEMRKWDACKTIYYPLMFNVVPKRMDYQRECRLIVYSNSKNKDYTLINTTAPILEKKSFR